MKKLIILTALVSIFSISAIAATYCYGYDYSRDSNNNKDCCIIFFTLTGDNYCDNGEFF